MKKLPHPWWHWFFTFSTDLYEDWGYARFRCHVCKVDFQDYSEKKDYKQYPFNRD